MSSEGILKPEEIAAAGVNRALPRVEREYAPDFSHALEQMTGEFIVEHFDNVRQVTFATLNDDMGLRFHSQHGFDFVIEWRPEEEVPGQWKEGPKLAVDVTHAQSDLVREEKRTRYINLDPFVESGYNRPVVDVHDGDGNVIARKVPHATVFFSKKGENEWRRAAAAWESGGKKGTVADWVESPLLIKAEILAGILSSIERSRAQFSSYNSQFREASNLLLREVKRLAQEAKEKNFRDATVQKLAAAVGVSF